MNVRTQTALIVRRKTFLKIEKGRDRYSFFAKLEERGGKFSYPEGKN